MTVQRNNCCAGQSAPLKSPLQPNVYPIIPIMPVLLVVVLLFTQGAFADCKEFKIVEYEDRVEAVCVGEPLTEAQKKANLEEEKRQEAASQRQRTLEEQKRQREIDTANKAQNDVKAAEERKKTNRQPDMPQKPVNKKSSNPNIIFK